MKKFKEKGKREKGEGRRENACSGCSPYALPESHESNQP